MDEGVVVLDVGCDGGCCLGVDASDIAAVVEDHCCESVVVEEEESRGEEGGGDGLVTRERGRMHSKMDR